MSARDGTNLIIAKDSIEVMTKVFTLGKDLSDVGEILQMSKTLAAAFPVVGAILTVIGNFLPNAKHEEILRCFNQLSTQIDRLRDDIKKLGLDLGWQQTEHQYSDAVHQLDFGINCLLEMGRAKSYNSSLVIQNRLRRHCDNNACTNNLNKLLRGITGEEFLASSSILDKFDAAIAKGHRKKIAPLATRLLQIASGGILLISTYDSMLYGQEEANDFIEKNEFIGKLENACRKAQSVLDRCVERFKENMLVDINLMLDKGGPNENLANESSKLMSDKYDWLENFALVYDDTWGPENHEHTGHFVESLHRNGKCGVVFYRTKGETPRFSDRYDEVYGIVFDLKTANAKIVSDEIGAEMTNRSIGIIGISAINHYFNTWACSVSAREIDIKWAGTFPTKIVILECIFCRSAFFLCMLYGATMMVFLQ